MSFPQWKDQSNMQNGAFKLSPKCERSIFIAIGKFGLSQLPIVSNSYIKNKNKNKNFHFETVYVRKFRL
jgi:hypothetical protein